MDHNYSRISWSNDDPLMSWNLIETNIMEDSNLKKSTLDMLCTYFSKLAFAFCRCHIDRVEEYNLGHAFHIPTQVTRITTEGQNHPEKAKVYLRSFQGYFWIVAQKNFRDFTPNCIDHEITLNREYIIEIDRDDEEVIHYMDFSMGEYSQALQIFHHEVKPCEVEFVSDDWLSKQDQQLE
ncbi:hypothetical protein HAX54_041071, partial [Datura stramonium]|nr:hypothetical protein [Datura stramonium]